jgi:hypothetical protein
MVAINKREAKQVFDLNLRDKRGNTPLHFAVDKQDHEMFMELIKDPFIDPFMIDESEMDKPRKLSVIFSAFHKILYHREKFVMKRIFTLDLINHYTDFEKQATQTKQLS